MTKKRFIKKVMSYGIQRNMAKDMSTHVKLYGSYDCLFSLREPILVWRKVEKDFCKGALAFKKLRSACDGEAIKN